ncbi:hypothetical protein [Curtobacterium sp. ISL-83]|uniref:hypothetical protein n=1 Tax=Curtobacterium sp. ISL-83 TaxID=2819145 RepID=UPI001BE8297D|nr:hypothetical protein [Curtobacterium sp. ISL-83]MBT2501063.1 hypothetical protein [Curtobacterium sp. ISL-83]
MVRRRRRARTTALIGLAVGVVAAAACGSLVRSTGSGSGSLGAVGTVFGTVVIALVGIIVAMSFAVQLRRLRFLIEGAALSVLLPDNPTVTAAAIAPHLRSPDDYDRWVRNEGIRPAVFGARLPQWRWSAGMTRELLPGTTAAGLRRFAGITVNAAVIALVGLAVVLLLDHGPAVAFRIVGGAAVVALLSAAGVVRMAVEVRASAEYRAGYTTLTPMRHAGLRGSGWTEPDVRLGVDLVDASTHAILRAAGARALTVDEARQRRRMSATPR